MIEINNLYKTYGNRTVLDNINLTIKKGSIFGLIGKNGAGKSTLIKCLTGIFRVDGGYITVNHEEVFENPKIKEKIGYVPDETNYPPSFKVKEIVKFYSLTYKTFSSQKFKELNKIFQIPQEKKIKSLSKGMKMRLSIMLNLSISPEIIILDEPMSGLDPIIKKEVTSLILNEVAERHITLFISSHNLDDIERICDTIAILDNGKIIYTDDVENMKRNIKKLQVVFKNDDIPLDTFYSFKEVLNVNKIGKITYIVTKQYSQEFENKLFKLGANFVDEIDISLNEMFIYSAEEVNKNEVIC